MKTSLGTMQTKSSCVLGLQVLASGVIAVASISALALALRNATVYENDHEVRNLGGSQILR